MHDSESFSQAEGSSRGDWTSWPHRAKRARGPRPRQAGPGSEAAPEAGGRGEQVRLSWTGIRRTLPRLSASGALG